jgi:hypothetical protein
MVIYVGLHPIVHESRTEDGSLKQESRGVVDSRSVGNITMNRYHDTYLGSSMVGSNEERPQYNNP